MMNHERKVLMVAAVLVALVASVSAHGWLMDPVPRGGGGTGSGNASTRRPCGKAGPTDVVRTLEAGQPFEVTYKRANRHGSSGNNVDFFLSYQAAGKAEPAAADFVVSAETGTVQVGNRLPMSVEDPNPQSATLVAPSTVGPAVLQFVWQPRTDGQNAGGAWYDCAYVEVVATVPAFCQGNANPCNGNATCSGETRAECDCNVGFFGSGRGASGCQPLPEDAPVVVTVRGTAVSQDNFTAGLAAMLRIDEGRILFDRASPFNVTIVDEDRNVTETQTYNRVYFSIGAHPETGSSGAVEALRLLRLVQSAASPVRDLSIAAATYDGTTTTSSGGGGGGFPTGTSAGTIFGAAFGTTIALAVVAAGAVVYRRQQAAKAGVARPKYVPEYHDKSRTTSAGAPFTPAAAAPAAAAAAAAAPAAEAAGSSSTASVGAPEGGAWEQYMADDGVTPYWYNASTGESRWEQPL